MNALIIEMVLERCKKGNLEDAILIASNAHYGQTDRGKNPYILHPIAVMNRVSGYGVDYQIVAVLHDAVEDCGLLTYVALERCGFKPHIIQALHHLHRSTNETIGQQASRLAGLDLNDPATKPALVVKLADYKENSDLTRLKKIGDNDMIRRQQYLEAYRLVSDALREEVK